jgi:hypothetical protein
MSAWTKDKPTTGGWRWYRDEDGIGPLFLEHMPEGIFVESAVISSDFSEAPILGLTVEDLEGEWAPMPGPPK